MKEKVIKRLMNDGSNRTRKQAEELYEKYIDLSLKRGSETPKEIAEDITWFNIV